MDKKPFSLNAKENVSRYINEKKVEKYSGNKKNTVWIMIVDILITIVSLATFYYIFFVSGEKILKYFGYGVIILFGAFFIVRILAIVLTNKTETTGLSKLILVDENKGNVKTWSIKGKMSVLIGKNTKENEVDIDLSGTEYSELISRQHAVLNYSENTWFIEDIGSSNGSGIKRVNESQKFKLDSGKPYKLNSGDTIFIANTQILIK